MPQNIKAGTLFCMMIAAALGEWGAVSRQHRHLVESSGLGQPKHKVHVLHRLARGPFDEIVLHHHDDELIAVGRAVHSDA